MYVMNLFIDWKMQKKGNKRDLDELKFTWAIRAILEQVETLYSAFWFSKNCK